MDTSRDDLARQAKYLQATAYDLREQYENLTTFSEAAQFDSNAFALIQLFEKYHAVLHNFRSQAEQSLRETKAARDALPLHKRIFSSRGEEKSHRKNMEDFDKSISNLENTISLLQELIDSTPASKAEQKGMLQKFSITKKELTLEKRRVNEEMRNVRTAARQKMTNWTGVRGGTLGKVARYQRTAIRLDKESTLSPLEKERAIIERQQLEIEKQIIWVSKFVGDDPEGEHEIICCAYCGRRMDNERVCPGCGSTMTIIGK